MLSRLAAAFAVATIALSCTNMDTHPTPAPAPVVPEGPIHSNRAAVVVIHRDGNKAKPDQDPVKFCARNGMTRNSHKIPATVMWVVDDKDTKLGITFDDTRCVANVLCHENVCVGMSNKEFNGDPPGTKNDGHCHYTITFDGTATIDPGADVENCCP
jgi:hypothetical protein